MLIGTEESLVLGPFLTEQRIICVLSSVFIYISRNILDGNDFMDMIPKTEAKEKENTDKLDLIKLKRENVSASKNTIKEATI